MNLLTAISVSIICAAVLALLASRLRQPLVLGYIGAGAILGPHLGFGVVTDETSIELISQIGLILLLFIIGLQINVPRLAQAGRIILLSGLGYDLLRDVSPEALAEAREHQARRLFPGTAPTAAATR